MPGRNPISRSDALVEVQKRFIARSYPRVHILLILALSGLAAFLFSAGTLRLGLDHMGVRYFAAMLAGYATFLLLIRAWIEYQRYGVDPVDALDAADAASSTADAAGSVFAGGGSGGAGGGAGWDSAAVESATAEIGFDASVDDAWPVVVAAICALAGLLAIVYVVYAAPVLLAEIALDAALLAGLYRRLRREHARYWLDSALRLTWMPALVAIVFVTLAGFIVQWAMPAARSIGDVWRTLGLAGR